MIENNEHVENYLDFDISILDSMDDSFNQLFFVANKLLNVTISLEKKLKELFPSDNYQPRNLDRLIYGINQEYQQLKSLLDNPEKIKKQNIKSTNVFVFRGIVSIIESEVKEFGTESIEAVLETARIIDNYSSSHISNSSSKFSKKSSMVSKDTSITIDLILRYGSLWMKVKARNKQAIHDNFIGITDGSEKCITTIALEMKMAANNYPVNYKPPSCCIYFTKGVTQEVAEEIIYQGVFILIENKHDIDFKLPIQNLPTKPLEPEIVNIDITTLIVLVAEAAIHTKSHKQLIDYINSKERAIVTTSAIKHFQNLLKLGASNKEITRANSLILDKFNSFKQETSNNIQSINEEIYNKSKFLNLEIYEDDPDIEVIQKLKGSKIKPYHKGVFGTGHKLKAITLTSNHWLSTNAIASGLHLCVKTHDSFTLSKFDRKKDLNYES